VTKGDPTPLVPIMLLGWLPVVLVLFAILPKRRAAIVAFMFALLFLPVAEFQFKAFPEYTKMSATCFGIFLATLLFDTQRIVSFRPRWVDVPVVVHCTVPLVTSLVNGLGVYDGLSSVFSTSVSWLLPYVIGRIYFADLRGMRELVIGFFMGGLVYVPFCLWEIRMAPTLHSTVYGYHPGQFAQVIRYGGYRPVVFIGGSGLTLGLWMAFATLFGFWLWRSKSIRTVMGMPVWAPLIVLAGTTVLCKSTGAILLMFVGGAVLVAAKYMRSSLPLLVLAAVPLMFVLVRATGLWSAEVLVDLAERTVGPDRASSLETRVVNDTMLAKRARQRILLGWGGWGRSRVRDERGRDISITDSLWVIKFGTHGLVGLTALMAIWLLPAVLLRWRIPPQHWGHPMAAPMVAAGVVLCLTMVNNTLNSGVIPLAIVIAGGMAGLKKIVVQPRAVHRAKTYPKRRS
jgi:hypothetical protein